MANTDECYTPPWVFEKLGVKFAMDVCAPLGGVPHIPAKHVLTVAECGLRTRWRGRVWMNPPFSEVTPWMQKFISHGNGIALVPFSKSPWFDNAWRNPKVAFVAAPSTLKFLKHGKNYSIFMPTCFIAIGVNNITALERLGTVRLAA